MATFAIGGPRIWTSTVPPCQPFFRGGEAEPWVVEAASQTYRKGQLVFWDGSGNVAMCTQSSSKMTSGILGFVSKDGQNGAVGVPQTRVEVIRADTILVAQVWHATPASAVTNRNQLQDVFGLTLVTPATAAAGTAMTDVWVVDIGATPLSGEDASTALAKVRVIGFPTSFQGIAATIGDTYGPVLVQIVPFTVQTEGSGLVRNIQIR